MTHTLSYDLASLALQNDETITPSNYYPISAGPVTSTSSCSTPPPMILLPTLTYLPITPPLVAPLAPSPNSTSSAPKPRSSPLTLHAPVPVRAYVPRSVLDHPPIITSPPRTPEHTKSTPTDTSCSMSRISVRNGARFCLRKKRNLAI